MGGVDLIYVKVGQLKPGMVLAKSVLSNINYISLIARGQVLTESIIKRLDQYHLPGVYIESELSNDIVDEEFFSPVYKREIMQTVKNCFTDFQQNRNISPALLKEFSGLAESLILNILENKDHLLNIMELKDYDSYIFTHCLYVAILNVLTGAKLKLNNRALQDLALCGLLHDVGKLDIDPDIYNKTGQLTEEERKEVQMHPVYSYNRLKDSASKPKLSILKGILYHHERVDGNGYPSGLSGDDIPIYARITAVSDVYDSLTSNLRYRHACMTHEAIEYIMGCGGTHFDLPVMKAFLKTVTAYAPGMVVSLSDGSIGVVVKNNPENTLRPRVRLISPESALGQTIDLYSDNKYYNITVRGTLDEKHPIPSVLG